MKLSTRTQYGLRMLCQLAMEYQGGALQMGEIGVREGISEKYLGQIMLILKSSGLVLSVRGAQGGYYLSRPPDRIGLLEVFEILEGEVLEFGNEGAESDAGGAAGRRTLDAANVIWTRMRDSIRGVLKSYTLEDVAQLRLFQDGYIDYRI